VIGWVLDYLMTKIQDHSLCSVGRNEQATVHDQQLWNLEGGNRSFFKGTNTR
jgi:hypothetical protein